ncbi:MAG: Dimeric alpha-beta barrel [Gammaproteobacteria bacterium]
MPRLLSFALGLKRIAMNMSFSRDKESCRKALEEAGAKKVAFVYHLKIRDSNGYDKWLSESKNSFNNKRLFRVMADPAAREEMLIDEIVIDEFPSIQEAFDFISTFDATLKQACSEYTVLAIMPEPSVTFHLVKGISWLIQLFKGVTDIGTPAANWKAENVAVWPDENQMKVARSQDLDEPLFVYNLNKYKPVADYRGSGENAKKISGKDAYNRYSKIAGFELLRRGAYPVYGGKPLYLFGRSEDCMLADHWDHFIFVRYPQRRNLLATIESDEFHNGEVHRDAGLERVAIFMTKKPNKAN